MSHTNTHKHALGSFSSVCLLTHQSNAYTHTHTLTQLTSHTVHLCVQVEYHITSGQRAEILSVEPNSTQHKREDEEELKSETSNHVFLLINLLCPNKQLCTEVKGNGSPLAYQDCPLHTNTHTPINSVHFLSIRQQLPHRSTLLS